MGRPATMVDNQTPQYIWAQQTAYNAAGQMTQLTWGAGYITNGGTGQHVPVTTAETRAYNSLSQLTTITGISGLNGSTSYAMQYFYSGTTNNGQITSQHDYYNGTISYSYDSLNRLSTASGRGWGSTYTYDGFGNLTDKTVTAGSAPSWHVLVSAATNRITTAWYDANGNTTQTPGGAGYNYDGENRLGGGGEGHAYSPDNLRVWKLKTDGTEELHVYGAFGELIGTYPVYKRYTNPGGVFTGSYYVPSGTTNLYFAGKLIGTQDRLGSNGSFYPYGEEYTTTAQNGFKFATYYRDGTTLDYAKNRYYSSTMGRFMTGDPSRSNALGDPGQWNKYSYAGNDPVNSNDPNGLFPCTVGFGEYEEVTDCDIITINYGGGAPERVSPWDALSDTCKDALQKALPVKQGQNGIPFWLAALKRANEAEGMLSKAADANGIPWELLAAIGIRETGFLNIKQGTLPDGTPGMGRGIFQIDIGKNPAVNEKDAMTPSWAADWAASALSANQDALQKSFPNLWGTSTFLMGLADTYNHGLAGVTRDLRRGLSPDVHTTGHNYGRNVMDLMDCFH